MKFSEYESIIEAVLFVSGEAVSVERLAAAIDQDEKTTRLIVRNLADKYRADQRGLLIIEIEQSFQMCTNSKYFEQLKKVYEVKERRSLTPALLETLAIITYSQPVAKARIEEIRGVNADHAVNRLLEYGLIEEKGRSASPGRPILFGTTDEFLKFFGLNNPSQLPPLENDLEKLRNEVMEELLS